MNRTAVKSQRETVTERSTPASLRHAYSTKASGSNYSHTQVPDWDKKMSHATDSHRVSVWAGLSTDSEWWIMKYNTRKKTYFPTAPEKEIKYLTYQTKRK